jgi:hypothetical protein
MRVLHLPFNIASQITTTVRGLRDIGIDARGLAKSGVITSNDNVQLFPPRPKGLAGYLSPLQRYWKTLRLIAWADVVHWHYGWALHDALDVRFAHLLGKKMCVEYWGSDIRIGEVEAADNPLFAALPFDPADKQVATRAKSEEVQRIFAQLGARAVIPCPSLTPHLIEQFSQSYFCTRQRIYLPDFTLRYPDPARGKPVVLHAPSWRLLKGTAAVQSAVEELQRRSVQFEYKQIENMPHEQAMETMADCDVYVDQLIIGSHGLAALEAMALGKAVVCYIKPSMRDKYPPELPIVSADPQSLPDVLAELLSDRGRIADLGRRGRAYVEKYHDAVLLARGLADYYATL